MYCPFILYYIMYIRSLITKSRYWRAPVSFTIF